MCLSNSKMILNTFGTSRRESKLRIDIHKTTFNLFLIYFIFT